MRYRIINILKMEYLENRNSELNITYVTTEQEHAAICDSLEKANSLCDELGIEWFPEMVE
jgi:hypothetical protein